MHSNLNNFLSIGTSHPRQIGTLFQIIVSIFAICFLWTFISSKDHSIEESISQWGVSFSEENDAPEMEKLTPLLLSPEEEARQQKIDGRILKAARDEIARSGPYNTDEKGKIAFLFLSKGPLPLDLLWSRFFQDHPKEDYSIHVHISNDSFQLNETTTKFSGFHHSQIPGIETRWGSITMTTATRRLLATAIADPTVQRFILLSETCIPLHNFTFIREYLFRTTESYIASHHPEGQDHRYRRSFRSFIPRERWRKGSQWFVLNRRHAAQVVSDDVIYSGLKDDLMLISDEHYIQTLLAMLGEESSFQPRSVTYTSFTPLAWHPRVYDESNTTAKNIRYLQGLMRYDQLDRKDPKYAHTHSCLNNGKEMIPCYLFARKFSTDSLPKLLGLQEVLGY